MARIYGLPGPEPGDQLVFEVLHTLPDDWIIYAQPSLVHGSEVRNPDYALLHRDVGLIILEVKDWLSITDCTSTTATIAHRNKPQTTETSPIKQAETAAWVIVNRLKADTALTDYAGRLRARRRIDLRGQTPDRTRIPGRLYSAGAETGGGW